MRKKILNFAEKYLMVVSILMMGIGMLSLMGTNVRLNYQNVQLQSEIGTYRRQQFAEDFRQIKKSTVNAIVQNERKRREQWRLQESRKLRIQAELKQMAKWQQAMDDIFGKYPSFITKKGNSNISDIELLTRVMDAELNY